MSDMKFDNFQDLLEVVSLQNFDELTKEPPKPQFKKAVKVGDGFKKAVLVSKSPTKKVRKGKKFTSPKDKRHGRMIHVTNAKNSFQRAQKSKSRKGKKR